MNLKYSSLKSQYHPNATNHQIFKQKLKGLNRSQSTFELAKSTLYHNKSSSLLSTSLLTKHQYHPNNKQATFDNNSLLGLFNEEEIETKIQDQSRTSSLINKLSVWDREHIDYDNSTQFKYAKSLKEIEAYGLLLNFKDISSGNTIPHSAIKNNRTKEMLIPQMIHKRKPRYQTKSVFDFSVFMNNKKQLNASCSNIDNDKQSIQLQLNNNKNNKTKNNQSMINCLEEGNYFNSYKQFARQQNKLELKHKEKLLDLYHELVINRLKKIKYESILNDIYILLEEARTECSLSIDLINERIKKHQDFYSKSNEGLILKNTKLLQEKKFLSKKAMKKNTIKTNQLTNDLLSMREENHESDSSKNSSEETPFEINKYKSSKSLSFHHNNIIVDNKGSGHSRKTMYNFFLNQEKIRLYNEYKSIEGDLYDKIKSNNNRFKEIECELMKMIKENQTKLEETNNSMFTSKLMFQGLIKQEKNYYLVILKQGTDTRNEGLSWVIKRLLELNIVIDSSNFPNYLDAEQISFLIKKSDIENEIFQLKQISFTLKQKQQEILNEDHLQRLKQFIVSPQWDDKVFVFTFFQCAEDADKEFLGILNKKYEKIVEKHEEILKQAREIKMEDNQIKTIVKSIREKISKAALNKRNIGKEEDDDTKSPELIEKFLNEEQAQKNYYKDLRTIHQRIKVLEKDLNVLMTNEIIEFKRKFHLIKEKKHDLNEATSYYDTLSNALFGSSLVI